MNDEAHKKNEIHYTSYVPNLVPADDKTENKEKVTCKACLQTLKECDDVPHPVG